MCFHTNPPLRTSRTEKVEKTIHPNTHITGPPCPQVKQLDKPADGKEMEGKGGRSEGRMDEVVI